MWHKPCSLEREPMSYMAERLYSELTKNDEVLHALGPHKPENATSSIAVMAEAFELALRLRHGPVPRREDMAQTVDGIERFMKDKGIAR